LMVAVCFLVPSAQGVERGSEASAAMPAETFSSQAVSVPLIMILSNRSLAKWLTFHMAAGLMGATLVIAQTPVPTPDELATLDAGLKGAQLALRHVETDHWGTTRNRLSIAAFLRQRITTRDFKITHEPQLTAYTDDPPSNTIYLNPALFPQHSEEERAAIAAHEAYHGATPIQRSRSRFMMWWDSVTARVTARQLASTPAYYRFYKQNLATVTRNEYEALSYDLQYRIGLAGSQGYTDMREYFKDLGKRAGNPSATFQGSLAKALVGWDIKNPASIRFNEDVVLTGLLLNRFAPHYDTRILSEIAAYEHARSNENDISGIWFLSWLKDPAYYNPTIPASIPGIALPPAPAARPITPPAKKFIGFFSSPTGLPLLRAS
jgi:hypothetical protein